MSMVQRPIPGMARSRRHPRSWSAAPRSTRPACTSRAARTRAIARPSDRSSDCSFAGAAPARAAADGTSRSRVTAQRRPKTRTIARWISAALPNSMSCSVTAQASASKASGRRRTRSHGRALTLGPISASNRKRSWNGRRSSSSPSAKRIRAIASSPTSRSGPHAPSTTRWAAGWAARTTTGDPSTCRSRSSTPPRQRMIPSGALPAGSRTGQRGMTSRRTSTAPGSTSRGRPACGRRPGTSGWPPRGRARYGSWRRGGRAGGAPATPWPSRPRSPWPPPRRRRRQAAPPGGRAPGRWAAPRRRPARPRRSRSPRPWAQRIAGGGGSQHSLVDPIALDDPAAHRLHPLVHAFVGLEDPPHLAAGHQWLAARDVEVLDVELGRDARVLPLGPHPQEADPDPVDDLPAAQPVPHERKRAALGAPEHRVEVGDRDRHGDRLAVLLCHHEPVALVDDLHLHRVLVEVLLVVGDEAPVRRPRPVVDLREDVHLLAQVPPRHLAQRDPVLGLDLLGEVEHHGQHPHAVGHLEVPHEEVHRLGEPGALTQRLVVGRLPGLLDQRRKLVALDHDAALLVHREIGRSDHPVAVPRRQPLLRGLEERASGLGVVLELEEPEPAPPRVVELVVGMVDLGADPAHHAAVAAGQEQRRVAVVEERVEALAQVQTPLDPDRRSPLWRVSMKPVREVDELPNLPPRAHLSDLQRHGGRPYMPTSTDVFAKVREHDRSELLRMARELDALPYFRQLEGRSLPVVEMEGAPRIMLGSNNYLGLTGDERVMQGAQDALAKYGTGLTGSRFLNGTIPLHLELEREIAEWMGTADALVFTTGHQANVGTLGTILAPGDTVIADSADHASILDGCLLSRAKLRPFRHGRLDKLEKQLERAAEDGGGVLVVVDGVFSMEGDIAPLPEICELASRHGARVMVDEAHAAGVLGARGAGSCELLGVEDRVDLRMGTFSKSLASCGGFIAGEAEVIDYLRFSSRAFMFTAAAVPAAVGAALAALRIVRSPDGPELFARVQANAARLRDGLRERGFKVIEHEVATPIVPVLVEDDWKAALLWKALYQAGVYVNVAVHPAVPPGGALLRTSVMASHTDQDIDRALEVFAEVKAAFEPEHGPLPTSHA